MVKSAKGYARSLELSEELFIKVADGRGLLIADVGHPDCPDELRQQKQADMAKGARARKGIKKKPEQPKAQATIGEPEASSVRDIWEKVSA